MEIKTPFGTIQIDCNAPDPNFVSIYRMGDGTYGCQCITCSRCGVHTGNATQGHYWSFCKVAGDFRSFHMCCPNDCELEQLTPVNSAC